MLTTLFHKNTARLAAAAAEAFSSALRDVLAVQDSAVVAIPGGRSTVNFFAVLKDRTDIDWQRVHFFMLDERLVDLESPQSNFREMYERFFITLVDGGKLSWSNLHPFIDKPDAPDRGVAAYEHELAQFGSKYDIVIAGVGEDGHIAALFPQHAALEAADVFTSLTDAPKPPAPRMTSSVPLIRTARVALAFFIGGEKQKAYDRFMDGSVYWHDCPAKILQEAGKLYVVTDLQYDRNAIEIQLKYN